MTHQTGHRPASAGPRSVAICGSCLTRDCFNSRFNPDHKRWYQIDLAANQTSMIALMSPPVDDDFTPTRTMSDYDRWNIRSDLSREFLRLLPDLRPDILLLDFFGDVHFGVIRLDDGRYVTDNRWKVRHTDWYQERKAAGSFERIRPLRDLDAYVALWTDAMDRFATFVARHCPDTQVIVHCGLNTDEVVVPGRARPLPLREYKKLSPLDVAKANELWRRLDDHAVSAYGWEAIDLRDEHYPSTADHPWGPFYVHYTPDYYRRFLAELHVLDLQRTTDAETAERVRAIAAAGHEHAVRERGLQSGIVAELDRRVGELESLGVLRSARSAIGRRLRRGRATT